MRLPKEIRILFNVWVWNNSMSHLEKIFIRLFLNHLSFTYQFAVLTRFFDHYGIHMTIQPGRFLDATQGRCYFYHIIGTKQNLAAWEHRWQTQTQALREAIGIFWLPKGTELRNKVIEEKAKLHHESN